MKETMKKAIADKLRMIRLEKHDRIEDLALKSGVASSTISKYEQGISDMSLNKLEQILKPYNISLYIFFENILAKTHDN
ncbi:MAG: helix-turn-helix domain-containing protein [Tenericutes bacterium]|nr:helix-turn-helix domain-containing protein [Mycoplasmatota bacterium]